MQDQFGVGIQNTSGEFDQFADDDRNTGGDVEDAIGSRCDEGGYSVTGVIYENEIADAIFGHAKWRNFFTEGCD